VLNVKKLEVVHSTTWEWFMCKLSGLFHLQKAKQKVLGEIPAKLKPYMEYIKFY